MTAVARPSPGPAALLCQHSPIICTHGELKDWDNAVVKLKISRRFSTLVTLSCFCCLTQQLPSTYCCFLLLVCIVVPWLEGDKATRPAVFTSPGSPVRHTRPQHGTRRVSHLPPHRTKVNRNSNDITDHRD